VAMGHAHEDLISPLAAIFARRCPEAAVVEPTASPGSAGLAEMPGPLGTTALIYQHASLKRDEASFASAGCRRWGPVTASGPVDRPVSRRHDPKRVRHSRVLAGSGQGG